MMLALLLGVAFEGEITDPDGNGVEDATVVFYDLRFRFLGDVVSTDASGHFSADVPAQILRVRVLPPHPTTVSEIWYGGSLRACASPRIDPVQTGSIEQQLPWGGTLTGQLFTDDRFPYADVGVEAYPVWQSEVSVSSREVQTDAEGAFTITGLPPDPDQEGFVLAIDAGSAGPRQFYDGATSEPLATLIALEDGGQTDLLQVATFPGATLGGQVLSSQGPVAGAEVWVATSATRTTHTDAQGRWTVDRVAPGSARITAVADGFAATGLGDTPVSTEPVAVGSYDVVDDLVLTMPVEARVTGRIPDLVGEGASGGVLLVGPNRVPAYSAYVGTDGSFVLENLFPGTYALEVFASEDFDELPGPVEQGGLPVTVTLEEGSDVDLGTLEVEDAARVSGTVLDDTGEPIVGAAIIVQTNGGGPRYVDFSRADGSFDVQGLPAGTYDLQIGHGTFCEGDPTYVSIYYPSLVNPAVRRAVDLASGQVFDWDAVMPVDFDNDEMGDAWERANGLDPTVDDADADPDEDGFTNLDEYRLGTDPNEAIDTRGCGCATSDGMLWRPWRR